MTSLATMLRHWHPGDHVEQDGRVCQVRLVLGLDQELLLVCGTRITTLPPHKATAPVTCLECIAKERP